eukprot:COSAG01_NODE_95_length_26957_cov_48.328617_26_plen_89_part_00
MLLDGVNDSPAEARELIRLLRGIPAYINLIPFNPWPGAPYSRPSNNRIRAFKEVLVAGGLDAPIRATRGDDIMAACGQLHSEHIKAAT